MARAPTLDDLNHTWGQDLTLSPSGDLGRVSGPQRSQQRVLRRLMTGQGEYLWEPLYGAGIPQKIGEALDLRKIETLIRGQMLQEPSVSPTPAPRVDVRAITGGVSASVHYVALPDKQPVSLTFDLTG